MNKVWIVAVAAALAMAGRAETPKPKADVVTVFTYDETGVPGFVMARAHLVATAAFATAGIEIRWVKGQRLGEPRKAASGEVLDVVFDCEAPARVDPRAPAETFLGGGAGAIVHVYYNRLAHFQDRNHMPEFLGNVLAHEVTHALEGVARHSSEGLMKATWGLPDYGKMVRGPLPFAPVDLELLRAHFRRQMSAAGSLEAAR